MANKEEKATRDEENTKPRQERRESEGQKGGRRTARTQMQPEGEDGKS